MPIPLADDLQALASRLADLDILEADPIIQDQVLALSQVLAAKSSALAAMRSSNNPPHQNIPQAFQDLRLPDITIPDNSSVTLQSLGAEFTHRRQCGGWDPGERPSETAFVMPDQPRQYGMPLRGVIPLEPPAFLWPEELISKLGKPDAEQLVPAPPGSQPPVGQYPQAPVYKLNLTLDRSYRRGYLYAAPFLTADKAIERERMLNILVPPNICPARYDLDSAKFIADPIPGMVKLPLGIPLVHHVDGDPNRAVTVVCAHTLESLMQYEEGGQVQELVARLLQLTWGTNPTESEPGIPGIFELEGMQTNLRSKKAHCTGTLPGDGSFNLASTHGEGEGYGSFMPAVQTNTPQATRSIAEILQILHKCYRLIMPLCVSRREWEMMEFNGRLNNVPSAGGFAPGPTSCQVNGSSTANVVDIPDIAAFAFSEGTEHIIDLEEILRGSVRNARLWAGRLLDSIGEQGLNHGDFKDAIAAFTLFFLMFCLPPGSDLGPFIWNRGGIYLREMDVTILFTSFKGLDIHSGHPPTFIKSIRDAWVSMDEANKLYKLAGNQLRCGYVLYPSMAATAHNTQIAHAPSLHFLHSPAYNPRDKSRRYFSLHGETVLGDLRSRANCLGLEGVYCLANYLILCRLKLEININTLLSSITYPDEHGVIQHLEKALFDIDDDEAYEVVCLYQRYFAWQQQLLDQYSLGITKPEFKRRQKAIQDHLAGVIGQQSVILQTPHRIWPEPETTHTITKVINRKPRGSDWVWLLLVEGSTQPKEFPESTTS
ncbi:hypothetical protein GGX14DRAFT_453426, partial [Mycena pura]